MKNRFQIDINADVGEGIDNELDLMPLLSSCNIACGGHVGDLKSMTAVARLAKHYNVKIGAHPSFPDPINFGREVMALSDSDLFLSLKQQINALLTILNYENVELHHIKPHGALYNLAAKDEKTAQVIVAVIKEFSMSIKLYAPWRSVIATMARREQIEVIYEAFADRNYNHDLFLVSRKNENAILHKKEAVLNHVLGIIKDQKVTSVNGVKVPIKASTICVHGDTDSAVEIVRYLSEHLKKNNIEIK